MPHKPWKQNEEFGFSFPFRCWDTGVMDFTYPSHWHEYYEIFFVLQGKVTIVIDGDSFELRQGDMVLLDPCRLHGFPSSNPQTSIRIFQFAQSFFAKEDHMLSLVDYRAVFIKKSIIHAPSNSKENDGDRLLHTKMSSFLELLSDEYRQKAKGWQIAIKGELYRMFLTYVRGVVPGTIDQPAQMLPPFIVDERFERVMLFINQHCHCVDFDLNQAADEAALSRFHFSRFFKQRTGQSFYAYLSSVRVMRTQEMLMKTDLQVVDIARSCGFSSLSTFFRVFKSGTGYTPSQYRKVKAKNGIN